MRYNKYEVLGNDIPGTSECHKSCKVCFPRGAAAEEASGESADDSDLGSSDSSVSVEVDGAESPAVK